MSNTPNRNRQRNTNRPAQQAPKTAQDVVAAMNAKLNDAGTEITVSFKGKKATLPSLMKLPFDTVDEFFKFTELPAAEAQKAIIPLSFKLARYFAETNEDFKEMTKVFSADETSALVLRWIGVQNRSGELGK
jgi:hypothetical protein